MVIYPKKNVSLKEYLNATMNHMENTMGFYGSVIKCDQLAGEGV